MILFVPIFALVFISIYRPFDFDRVGDIVNAHIDISLEAMVLLVALIMTVSGMAIGTLSRLIMGAYTKRHTLTYLGYILWILGEIAAMAGAFTIAALATGTDKSLAELFRNSYVKTALIVVIPYVMCYIYFIWHENARELKELRKQIAEDETMLQKAYIHIADEKGDVRLSIRREHLVIVESADNYVCVYYLNNQSVKKMMIRNTLHRVAEQLEGTNIVRCHRSYVVNFSLVVALRREKEGVFVEFGIEGVPNVPISRTYGENVRRWMNING